MGAVVGIDFSTQFVDAVIVEDGLDPVWERWKLDGEYAIDRARSVPYVMPHSGWWLHMATGRLGLDAVGIEEPQAYGKRMGSLGVLYRVQGAILATIPRSILVVPWIPTQWRKACGLAGNASKEDVAVFAGRPEWQQDACDAYAIALATKTIVREGMPT